MLKRVFLNFLLLLLVLTSQKCYVSSGGAPGETVLSRHSTDESFQHHQQQQQQPNHHHSSQQHAQHPTSHGATHAHHSAGGGNSAIYHAAPGSGQHVVDKRNSYNLLSEAMSQAVSNEFSSLGSGSADGACQADDLDCYSGNVQDRLGMEAIRTLHRQLDDDDNGNIDLSESDDFLREELKYDSGYEKRQKAFHFNDDMHISVKELWEAWLRSEVHNWTIEQTTDWLAQSVQLPQYVELFKLHKVTGAALPRLAVNNMHYVGNVLGIKDPIHKQKIALKAMDVVLFGPPRETGTRWKDYILVTLLLSAIIGCWYAYQQNKNAKRHLRRMAQDMEGLQRAEQSLQEMQKELERARMEQENVATEKMDLERRLKEAPSPSSSSSDLEVQQLKKEIEMLRSELSRAEIELVDNCWSPPPQLQSWLQYTYEIESKNHLKKRIVAEKQLQSAREACEKLRKKRTSLVGAFVSTHGKSIDDVDRSIVEARNALGEVTNELQERLHRWKQIESCLGFNIVNNNGLSYLESILYGRNGGSSSKGSRGRMTSSTDDLDDDSVPAQCCDPKALTWYPWRSTLTSQDNNSNINLLQSQVATQRASNNYLSAESETMPPLVAAIARKWLNSTAPLVNNPHLPHHLPYNLHPHLQLANVEKDNHPVDGRHMSELCHSNNTSTHSSCSSIPNFFNNNTLEIENRTYNQQHQQQHQLQQIYPYNNSCQGLLACNLYAGNHNTAVASVPPPPHLRPLLRRHTVIPKWSIPANNNTSNSSSTLQQHPTTPVSMGILKNANEDYAFPLAAAVRKPLAMVEVGEITMGVRANLHSSHSASCLIDDNLVAGVSASSAGSGDGIEKLNFTPTRNSKNTLTTQKHEVKKTFKKNLTKIIDKSLCENMCNTGAETTQDDYRLLGD